MRLIPLPRRRAPFALFLAAVLTAACPAEPPGDAARGEWPQWHGPGGQGISSATGLPERWRPEGPAVRWKAPVPGVGSSSPIVVDGRVILTTAHEGGEGPLRRTVLAYDVESGELLWETDAFSAPAERKHWANTRAAPTPVSDGERIYAHFGPILTALDLDGNLLWQKDVDPDYFTYARYGAGSSPVLYDDLIILPQDREDVDRPTGWIAAYERTTGEPRWKTEWTHSCCSYSTPVFRPRPEGGADMIFSQAAEIVAYDPATGERLWNHLHHVLQPVPTPVLDGDLLGIAGGSHGGTRGTVFVRLTGYGAETEVEELWRSHRESPRVASPVLYNGLYFSVTEGALLRCYDPETGEIVWRRRLKGGTFHASLVAGDDKVYAIGDNGTISVFAAQREYKRLGQSELGEGTYHASPAIGGGCLLVRGTGHLHCIENPAAAAAAKTAETAG